MELIPDATILESLDTVERAVEWFLHHPDPDLIFMDIQLADGLSFDIFKHSTIKSPVIFTTAFDQYTLRAFKVNSIGYLLKPIEKEELKMALDKYQNYYIPQDDRWKQLLEILQQPQSSPYRQRFLIKQGNQYNYLLVSDIHFIYSEDGVSFALDKEHKRFIIDESLDGIQTELDTDRFFRINRSQIVRIDSISEIHSWLNHRLKLKLSLNHLEMKHIVSRERVQDFKKWLDR